MRKLGLDDIKDLRAYERERDEFRKEIIAMKKLRRVQLGDLITLVFENTETMRFQIQEMARIERLITDAQIEHEVSTYNALIPDHRELSATLFLELTDDEQLRKWLPRFVGIQRAVSFWLPDGSRARCVPQDEERLTRDEITTTVHYLKFPFSDEQVASFRAQPGTRLVIDHPAYDAVVELSDEQRAELARDLEA
ncbi:MAG TPA: DUF3501 family protein [Acidimicrobiia bacterium]|nr:DUF3501 family protein [Acidimicrobiia bacterium]